MGRKARSGDSNDGGRANHTDVGMPDMGRKRPADNRRALDKSEGRSLGHIDTGNGESQVCRRDQRTVEGNTRLRRRIQHRLMFLHSLL